MKNPKDKAANQAGKASSGMNEPKITSAFGMAQKMMDAGWFATPMGVEIGSGEPLVALVGGSTHEGPPWTTIRTWDWQADDPQFEISFYSGEMVGEMFLGPRDGLTVRLKEDGGLPSPQEATRLLKAAGY